MCDRERDKNRMGMMPGIELIVLVYNDRDIEFVLCPFIVDLYDGDALIV